VTHILANAPQKVTSVSNGDHSKMFERLPHTMIIAACMHKFKIAADTKKSRALLVNRHTGQAVWSREWPTSLPVCTAVWVRLDADTYKAMVELILSSATVDVGGELYRQALGIPMGFDDSPYMSQSFFDYLDYCFITEAVAAENWSHSVAFSDMHRVADDVFCYNRPDFFEIMKNWGSVTYEGETYCAWDSITLNDETHYGTVRGERVGISAEMCDTTISWDPDTFEVQFRLYDKLQHLKSFSRQVIRYTSAESCGPRAAVHGTVVGQLKAFAPRSRSARDFATASTHLIVRLLCNGHGPETIIESVRATECETIYGKGPRHWGAPAWQWTDKMKNTLVRIVRYCDNQLRAMSEADRKTVSGGVASSAHTALISKVTQNVRIRS
jgi:hypothetical protein